MRTEIVLLAGNHAKIFSFFYVGILATLLLLVIVLIIIFLGKQICISIAIIKEASKYV